jgi:hypothetical protein
MIRKNRTLFTGYFSFCFLIFQWLLCGSVFADDNQPSSANYGKDKVTQNTNASEGESSEEEWTVLKREQRTGNLLLARGTPGDENPFFPLSWKTSLIYFFRDPVTKLPAGYYGVFDNGVTWEALAPEDPQKSKPQITKIAHLPGDDATYWFLWGDNVYQGQSNVVIKETATGAWTAYKFKPNRENFEQLMQGLTLIGAVADPTSLALPELGDWAAYCAANNII